MAVNGAIPQQSLSNMSFGPPSSARDADADHSFIVPQQSLSNMSFGPPSSASDADADHSFIVLDRMTAEDSEKIVNELTASVCAFNINTNLGDSVTSTNHFGENPASTPSTYCNGELLSNLSDGSLSSEVRQRMNSLVLENTNLQVTVNQTNVALKQLMTTLEQCRGEMDQVRQEHKEKFQETRDLVLKLKKEKAEMRIVIEELQTKVEELQGQTPSDSLRDDNVRLGNALQNLSSVEKHSQEYQDAQVKGFIQRVDELTAKLMCTEEQLAKAKSEIAQLKSFEIVQHAESTMTLNEEALSNAKATVDRLRLRIDEMTAKIVELDQKCENQAQEISSLQKENSKQSELVGILQAQVEVYRTDFIAERDCREKLAGEKEQLALDLRRLHRHNLELQEQRTVTQEQGGQTSNRSAGQREEEPQNSYRCPICQIMTFRTLQALNEHIDRCMENNSLS